MYNTKMYENARPDVKLDGLIYEVKNRYPGLPYPMVIEIAEAAAERKNSYLSKVTLNKYSGDKYRLWSDNQKYIDDVMYLILTRNDNLIFYKLAVKLLAYYIYSIENDINYLLKQDIAYVYGIDTQDVSYEDILTRLEDIRLRRGPPSLHGKEMQRMIEALAVDLSSEEDMAAYDNDFNFILQNRDPILFIQMRDKIMSVSLEDLLDRHFDLAESAIYNEMANRGIKPR